MTLKFEKLTVWQKAVEFNYQVHELTRKFLEEVTMVYGLWTMD